MIQMRNKARVLDGKSRAVRSICSLSERDCWRAFNYHPHLDSRSRYLRLAWSVASSRITRACYHVHPDVRPAVTFAPSASGRSRECQKCIPNPHPHSHGKLPVSMGRTDSRIVTAKQGHVHHDELRQSRFSNLTEAKYPPDDSSSHHGADGRTFRKNTWMLKIYEIFLLGLLPCPSPLPLSNMLDKTTAQKRTTGDLSGQLTFSDSGRSPCVGYGQGWSRDGAVAAVRGSGVPDRPPRLAIQDSIDRKEKNIDKGPSMGRISRTFFELQVYAGLWIC
jgi:hypothetical protein